MKVAFEDLKGSDLIIDCFYSGGNCSDFSNNPPTPQTLTDI